MPSDSNSLLQEPTRRRPPETHPHAEVLAAFAKESLLPGESDKVLAHLSRCAECRAVLRVSTSALHEPVEKAASPAPAHPGSTPPRRWLPGLATAAAIVGISAGVVLYRHHSPRPEAVAPNAQVAQLAQVESPTLPPAASNQGRIATAPSKTQSIKAAPVDAAHSPAQPASAHAIPARPSQPDSVGGGHLAAHAPRGEAKAGESAAAAPSRTKALADTPPPLPENPDAYPAASPGDAVQASQGSTALFPPASTASQGTEGDAIRPGTAGQASGGLSARLQWRIGEGGQVERSFGDGAWQQVFDPRVKLRVVAAVGNLIWAGGDDMHLYRSRDNGATWSRIELPARDGGPSAIEHIRFETSHEGRVESDNGNSWTTTDGGTTWQ